MTGAVMGGNVVDFPRSDLRHAREVVAHPDLYSGPEIVAACKQLVALGNADDVRAVLALQRAGIVAGFEVAGRAARRVRKRDRWWALLGFYLLLAIGVGTVEIVRLLLKAIGAMSG